MKAKEINPGVLVFDNVENEWGILLKEAEEDRWKCYWSDSEFLAIDFKRYPIERFEFYSN